MSQPPAHSSPSQEQSQQPPELDPVVGKPDVGELDVGQCVFCLRIMKHGTTEHHLIPRCCHKNRWFQKRFSREQMRETVATCRDCHKAIHKFVPREKDLGREFNTIADLMAHPEIARFVDWVSRQS